jgi:hypothetical protein
MIPNFAIAKTPARRMPVWEELIYRRDELELAEWIEHNAPEHIKKNLALGKSRPWLINGDGGHYRDTRQPLTTADHPSVTLSTTAKALWVSTEGATALPANYWTVGKHIEMTAFGRMTSGTTPGNITISINNSTADAGGTAVSSNAVAWSASQTAKSWHAKAYIHCRSVSSTGTLFMTGKFECAVGAIASTLAPLMLPDNTPATVTQDTTAAGGITFQALRSGSTAETMQTHELMFESLTL